jgi:protoheme IX farnesyltransferase
MIPARAGAAAAPAGLRELVSDYYELTKPRIIYLLLITTAAAMVMAAHGIPPLALTFWTLVGGALSAGSAGALNCVFDRDIDRLMRRTMMRPLAAGRMAPLPATIYAAVLGVASFALLYAMVNPLAAWLSLIGLVYYVLVYTMWLKRSTTMNIVIGGAAGSLPPLVGWAAVTGSIGAPAIALALLVFLWTPPHFWALALMTGTDYSVAKVPMLPNVHGERRTQIEILIYTIVTAVMAVSLYPLHVMGIWYFVPAVILNGLFLIDAVRLFSGPIKQRSRKLFKFSLLYLALMCAAMVLDRLIIT